MQIVFADDNTSHVTGDSIEDVINSLENVSIKLFKLLADNQMNVNKGNYHLHISGSENITINVGGNIIEKSICEKLVGIIVDHKLTYK